MAITPSWNSLKAIWPNVAASRFIDAAELRWHVQVMGDGPAILLLHGSGAASHSWRNVAPELAKAFTVVIPDLPGHGFTSRPRDERFTLDAMADDLLALMLKLDIEPKIVGGHSAGGALALRLATLRSLAGVVTINAALSSPKNLTATLASPVRALARTGAVGLLTAWLAESDAAFSALMRSTGSTVSPEQYELYHTFARSPEHASALMRMFSSWDVNPLLADLVLVRTRATFVVGSGDEWVPPVQSERVAALMHDARVISIENAGHLAHEEFPKRVASIIADSVR